MVARAAGDDEHLVDVAQLVGAQPHLVEDELAAGARAGRAACRPPPSGCSCDLLGHEVLVAALLRRLEVPGDRALLGLDRLAVQRRHRQRARGQHGQLVVGQRVDAAGVPDERRDVGGEQSHAVLEPEDERREAAGGHDGVGLVGGDRPRWRRSRAAGAARRGSPRPATSPSAISLLDQVGHHLGVGGRDQRVPARLELGPQLGVVLDDAVVDRGPAGRCSRRGGGRSPAVGPPWVAQRVCPMAAAWPVGASAVSSASLATESVPPAARARQTAVPSARPPWRRRPSRSPGTPAGAAPPRRSGMASASPVTPMMPHIGTQATWATWALRPGLGRSAPGRPRRRRRAGPPRRRPGPPPAPRP